MVPVSVVIITKNVGDIIEGCITQAAKITDDVIVVYNGANKNTYDNCRLIYNDWEGYGANKNKGVEAARYSWILSIDADEIPDNEVVKAIHNFDLKNTSAVYDIKFRSYFGKKPIRFGSWGHDHHVRLFNRELVKWSESMVHETLVIPQHIDKKRLPGQIHHYSVKDVAEFETKGTYYANLSARKYFRAGKKANIIKLYLSPAFGFFKNYIIRLGFLDGREGWLIARTTIKNTRHKYRFLSQMETLNDKREPVKDSFVVEY